MPGAACRGGDEPSTPFARSAGDGFPSRSVAVRRCKGHARSAREWLRLSAPSGDLLRGDPPDHLLQLRELDRLGQVGHEPGLPRPAEVLLHAVAGQGDPPERVYEKAKITPVQDVGASDGSSRCRSSDSLDSGRPLVILAQPPIPAQPGERPLHDPTPLQHLERLALLPLRLRTTNSSIQPPNCLAHSAIPPL